jgi:hypothetical protein
VRFGRPHKPSRIVMRRCIAAQAETQTDIARSYAADPATISRLAAGSPFEHGAAVAR